MHKPATLAALLAIAVPIPTARAQQAPGLGPATISAVFANGGKACQFRDFPGLTISERRDSISAPKAVFKIVPREPGGASVLTVTLAPNGADWHGYDAYPVIELKDPSIAGKDAGPDVRPATVRATFDGRPGPRMIGGANWSGELTVETFDIALRPAFMTAAEKASLLVLTVHNRTGKQLHSWSFDISRVRHLPALVRQTNFACPSTPQVAVQAPAPSPRPAPAPAPVPPGGLPPSADDLAIAGVGRAGLYARSVSPSLPSENLPLAKCLSALGGYGSFEIANRCSFPVLVSLTYGEINLFTRNCNVRGSAELLRVNGGASVSPPWKDTGSGRAHRSACVIELRHIALASPVVRPRTAQEAQNVLPRLTAQAGGEIGIEGKVKDSFNWLLRRRIASVSAPEPCTTRFATSDTTHASDNFDRSLQLPGHVEIDWRTITRMSASADRLTLHTATDSFTDSSYQLVFPSREAMRAAGPAVEALILRC